MTNTCPSYNRNSRKFLITIDWSVINDVRQRCIRHDIGNELTVQEFKEALNSLANHKAPALNGVTAEALKALDDTHCSSLFEILQRFYTDDIDIEEWKKGNLKVLPKSGDLTSLHKWQGINLLDTASKLMSRILTKHLQKALSDEGYPLQFGSTPNTGCPDAQLILKSALQLRREYSLDTWTVFIDLVKAFDTVSHEMLLKLLAKFRVPRQVIRAVEKMYKDFELVLKIGDKKL